MAEQLEIEIVLKNLNEVEKYLSKSLKEIEKYEKATKKNEKSLLGVTKAQEKLSKAQEKLSRSLKEYSKEGSLSLEKLNDSLNDLTKNSQNFSSKMSESLNDLKKNLLESFRVSESFKESFNLENFSLLEETTLQEDLDLLNSVLGESDENFEKLALSLILSARSGESFSKSIKMADQILSLFSDNSAKALESLVALVSVAQDVGNISFEELAYSFKEMAEQADLSQFSMLDLGIAFTSLSISLDPLGNSLELTSLLMKETISPTQELSSIYVSLGISTDNLGQKQSSLTSNLSKLEKAYAKNKEVLNSYFQELQKGPKIYQANSEAMVDLAGNLENVSKEVKTIRGSLLKGMESFNKSIESIKKFENLNESIKKLSASLKDDFNPEARATLGTLAEFGLSLGLLNEKTLENIESCFIFANNLKDIVEKAKNLELAYKALNGSLKENIIALSKDMVATVKWIGKSSLQLLIIGLKTVKYTALTIALWASSAAVVAYTAVMAALNFVMSLNPVAVIVVGFKILIGVLAALSAFTSMSKNANEELNDSMERGAKSHDSNAKSAKNNAKAQEELAKKAKETAKEIEELAKKEETSILAKEKIKDKIKELMTAYPSLTEEVIRSQMAIEGGCEALVAYCSSINKINASLDEACEKQKKTVKGWWIFKKEVENPEGLAKESDSQQWLDVEEKELIKKLEEQGGSDLVELYYQSLYDDTQEFAVKFNEKIQSDLQDSDAFLAKALIERRSQEQESAQNSLSSMAQEEMATYGIDQEQERALKKFLQQREQEISTIKSSGRTEEEKNKLIESINELYEKNVKSLITGPDLSEVKCEDNQLDSKLEELKNKFNSQVEEYKIFLNDSLDQLEKEKQEAQERFEKSTNFDPDIEFNKVDMSNDPWGLGDVLNTFGELMTSVENLEKAKEEKIKKATAMKDLEDTNNSIDAKKNVVEESLKEVNERKEATDLTIESMENESKRIAEAKEALEEMMEGKPSQEEGEESLSQEEIQKIEERRDKIVQAIEKSNADIETAQNQSSNSLSSDKSQQIEEGTRSTIHKIKEGGEKEARATEESGSQVESAIAKSTSRKAKGNKETEDTYKEGSDNNVEAIKKGGKKERQEVFDQGQNTEKKLTEQEEALKEKQKDLAMALAGSMANSVNSMVSDVANLAGQKHLQQLDQLEEEINQRLQEYQEAREEEEERIREEKAEREREERLQEIELSLASLEQELANETSVKKRAQLASQIEEANKKKIEERKKREEELAEKERIRQEKIQLYEFEVEKYNIEVQRIERQNKMAEQEKAQKIAQVWIDASMGIARAWALQGSSLFTAWYPPIFTGLMAGVAAGQTAMIASQNVKTTAPAAPKPPKFKKGGVIGNHGEQGIDAVVGDGVSEVILPLTSETFAMFGAGVLEALQDSISKKELLLPNLEKGLGEYANEGNQIHIAHCENVFSPQQIINVNQTNNIPIEVHGEEEAGEKIEAMALKVVGEIKDNIKVGANFDKALLSHSRGVLNALKDQGVL